MVDLARKIINGEEIVDQAQKIEVYKRMKQLQRFNLARKILTQLKKENPNSVKITQQLALCTYKDPDLGQDIKYDKAIEILKELGDLKTIKDIETLGLLGAIYKRKWKVDNRIQNLIKSQAYYGRGSKLWFAWKKDPQGAGLEDCFDDMGYCSVNYAFIMELVASISYKETKEVNAESDLAEAQRIIDNAIQIRKKLIAFLEPEIKALKEEYDQLAEAAQKQLNQKLYWMHSTIGECYVGIRDYDSAKAIYHVAKGLINKNRWEYFSTAHQITSLAQVQKIIYADDPKLTEKINETLSAFLGDEVLVQAMARGKLGLALSGGGFRASFFHIGVLAYLAEKDLLRYIESLSCVSGGSLIGAYYYLKIKNLLDNKKQSEIEHSDYIQLVQEMQKHFFAAVTNNLRLKIFDSLVYNAKMLWSTKKYTRSVRIASLYNKYLYQPLLAHLDKFKPKKNGEIPKIRMTDLYIYPKGEDDFRIKKHNWLLAHKVPNLILNATSLNTGHNWQFTASWMGEPPGSIIKEVDAKYRLRRVYYWDIAAETEEMDLATAVAASSCVPGIFEPLVLENVYPNKTVRLVDGGVHDNQGVASLIEQECKIIIVSDASGQLTQDDEGSSFPLTVLSRTNNIFMERIRESQYLDLSSRLEGAQLSGLMFLHLWKDLNEKPLSWDEEKDPWDPAYPVNTESYDRKKTTYGISKELQKLLAGIRTDLDAFNEREAYALMYSGYKMAASEYSKSIQQLFPDPVQEEGRPVSWDFMAIEDYFTEKEKVNQLRKQLQVSKEQFLKFFKLSNRVGIWAIVIIALIAIIPLCFFGMFKQLLIIGGIALVFMLFKGILGQFVKAVFNLILSGIGFLFKLILLSFALIGSKISLWFFNNKYLRKGRLKKNNE